MPMAGNLSALGADIDAGMLRAENDVESPDSGFGPRRRGESPVFITDNDLWIDKSLRIRKGFVRLYSRYYGGNLSTVDFSNATQVASSINEHVKCVTKGLISEIAKADDFKNAIFALANTVYFKGQWDSQFKEGATKESLFYADEGAKSVNMMHGDGMFKAFINDDYVAIRLPFVSEDVGYSTIAILPILKEGESPSGALMRVEKTVDISVFEKLSCNNDDKNPRLSRLNEEVCSKNTQYPKYLVELSMPKFKTESTIELKELLMNMGIVSAFDSSKADFSFISGDVPISIQVIRQMTSIDFNEKGVEAAAVTLVEGAGLGGMGVKVIKVSFDHPFYYAIVDDASGTILMNGHYLASERECVKKVKKLPKSLYSAPNPERRKQFGLIGQKARSYKP